MARAPKDIEMMPDAWARFERAVDVVAKSPPQHRVKAKPKRIRGDGGAKGGKATRSKAKGR